jgi:hypothetical protein
MVRHKQSPNAPLPASGPPWLVGAMIGMTIMTMAGTAMTLGAGMALTKASVPEK